MARIKGDFFKTLTSTCEAMITGSILTSTFLAQTDTSPIYNIYQSKQSLQAFPPSEKPFL